jgi:beta-lactamase class A
MGAHGTVRQVLLCIAVWAVSHALPAQPVRFAQACRGLEAKVTAAAADGVDIAVAYQTLDGGLRCFLRSGEPFHAASTMKVPVLIELYDQVQRKKVTLTDTLPVRNEFKSLADGSSFSLDVNDDSEASLYSASGETRTLGQLAELMITVSSNFAANLLIDRLGVANIRAEVRRLGADGMNVQRDLEDSKAFRQGLNNTTTARGLFTLMDAIARGRAVSDEASREMSGILARQTFNDAIPAGVPAGIKVAHKTGEITRIDHDAAIVYAPRPFVLVVLTRGVEDHAMSASLIADITRQLYAASQRSSPAPAP